MENLASSFVLAYLDPMSGSIIVQVLIATVVGAAFLVKRSWRSIRDSVAGAIGRNRSREE